MKYHIITFGCQMNISDSERATTILKKIGYKSSPEINGADLVLVNMCSVRQSAVDRVLGLEKKFQQAKKINPEFKSILTGCFLKKDQKKFQKIFDEIINIKDIGRLTQIMGKRLKNTDNYLEIEATATQGPSAFVPIMTGCDNFCAYCVVPHTRGREVSRPADEINFEIKKLIKTGFKEIWLLGHNVNSYNNGKTNFPKLLKMVNDIPGKFWIRFTSPHPKDFSNELINVMARSEKNTPYLNLPVQAGDDKVLKKMNRNYTVAQYKNLIKKIKKQIPDISLSTDIIVGFPGETKKQFENSVKLFEEIKYDMAYISKYSPRFGTAAAKMKDDTPIEEKNRRKMVLNEILKKTATKHNKIFVGKIVEVLVGQSKNNLLVGKSWHYKTVRLQGQKKLVGQFIKVKITETSAWGLKGELI